MAPFSVEAVPAPAVKPIDDAAEPEPATADGSVTRSGETLRQSDWRDELLRTGIRGKAGQFIRFARRGTVSLPFEPGEHGRIAVASRTD